VTEFKTYEEMTRAERDARNRDAFTWKDGDLIFDNTNATGKPGESSSDEELDAYYEQLAKEKGWTPEERDKRNEDAFNWKEGDIEILDPGDPAGDEDFEDVVPEEQPKTR
jgi:hypothetical protein